MKPPSHLADGIEVNADKQAHMRFQSDLFTLRDQIQDIVDAGPEALETLKNDLQKEFADMFLGELGVDDHIRVEPVKLKVRQEVADPYHCLSPASIIFTLTDYINH